jgi:hypothetical protein
VSPGNVIDFERALFEMMRTKCVPVADGVLAHVLDNGVWVEVRGVLSDTPRIPGAVGRWLDTLPHDRRVIVPAVISDRLRGMLARRGFVEQRWYDHRIRIIDEGAMVRRRG